MRNLKVSNLVVKDTRKKKRAALAGGEQGFTLIELLLVIVIIGILAGVVIAVINPRQQAARAREGVARANLSRVCQALVACMSSLSSPDASKCVATDSSRDGWTDSETEFNRLGTTKPDQPAGWTYQLYRYGTTDDAYIWARAKGDGCEMRCIVFNDFRNYGRWGSGNSTRPGAVRLSGGCRTN